MRIEFLEAQLSFYMNRTEDSGERVRNDDKQGCAASVNNRTFVAPISSNLSFSIHGGQAQTEHQLQNIRDRPYVSVGLQQLPATLLYSTRLPRAFNFVNPHISHMCSASYAFNLVVPLFHFLLPRSPSSATPRPWSPSAFDKRSCCRSAFAQ